jgi:hypothetical protein
LRDIPIRSSGVINEGIDTHPRPEAFARWFVGSKIVDEAGRPLVLYHGTSKDADFKSFKVPKNGAWFATDPQEASTYASENDSAAYRWDGLTPVRINTASRVLPVFVRAVNPKHYDMLPEELRFAQNYKKAQATLFAQLRAEGHDAITIGQPEIAVVVALGGPQQIKSAIGNKTFDPDKKGLNENIAPSMWEAVVNGDGHLSLLTHPGTRRWRKMKAKSEPGTPDWFKTWFTRPYLTNGPKGQQIKEGRDAPLYHGTSAMLAADIIRQDAITAGYNEVRLANGDIVEGVSLTRDPRVALRFGPVVFELDQAKLVRDGHRMVPHDHWGTGSDELSGDDATDTAPLRTGIRYEAEELVVGSIEDLSRYIRSIHFDASVLGEPLGTAYGNACSIVTEHPLSHEVPQRWSRRRAPERYLNAIHIAEAPIRATLYTNPSYYGATVQASNNIQEPVVLLPTNKITVFEPDLKFDDPKYAENLKKIKAAIKKGKQFPAILVRRLGTKYQVVDGHHRFKAYRDLKIKQIPARIVLPQNITVTDNPEQSVREAWSKKYKNSINCDNPKGFSQRAHCAGRKIRSHRSRRHATSINEGRDAPLFHGTGFPNAVHILDDKEIEARTLQFAPNRDGLKGVSLSRSMDVSKRWGPVVFEFDQAKLAHRYRMNPIDYWGQGREPELAGEARRHGRFAELEEFIDGPIRDPERYLKAIHISVAGAKRALGFGLMADDIRRLMKHPLAKPMP